MESRPYFNKPHCFLWKFKHACVLQYFWQLWQWRDWNCSGFFQTFPFVFQRWRWVTDESRTPHKYGKITVTFYNDFFSTLALMKLQNEYSEVFQCTSNPCSLPRFIMSLHSLGTWDIRSTDFCYRENQQKPVFSCFNKLYKHLKCIILSLWLTIILLFKTSIMYFNYIFYLYVLTIQPCLCAVLQEVLKRSKKILTN